MNLNRKYWKGNFIERLENNQIFVFGSNPSGIHGAGAAKSAIKFGAWYGEGRGLYGQTYAIVTKNLYRNFEEPKTGIIYTKIGEKSVTPEQIKYNIQEMYDLALNMPEKEFLITYQHELDYTGNSKKSLNGYTSIEILDMFIDKMSVPDNIIFHDSFKSLIENKINSEPNLEFFWQTHSTFSQWHPSKFKYKEIQFISAEQFMMYSKAKLFQDEVIAEKILDFNRSHLGSKFISGELTGFEILNDQSNLRIWNAMMKTIKNYGREIRNYNEDIWIKKRIPIVSVGSREKYNQNPAMKRELLSKGNSIMVEASPYDKIWGIGLKSSDPRAKDRSQWQGLNLLGQVLTELRNNLELELKKKPRNKLK